MRIVVNSVPSRGVGSSRGVAHPRGDARGVARGVARSLGGRIHPGAPGRGLNTPAGLLGAPATAASMASPRRGTTGT